MLNVLNPFEAIAVRGPSDFYQPTSLISYQYEKDITFTGSFGLFTLFPHCAQAQVVTNAPTWFNYMSSATELTQIGGAGITAVDSILTGYGASQLSSSTARWISYRVISCGVKVIPLDNITVKAGIITAGQVPGMNADYNVAFVGMPSIAALR